MSAESNYSHYAVPPRVQPEPPTGEIVVRSGASVNLECKVRPSDVRRPEIMS